MLDRACVGRCVQKCAGLWKPKVTFQGQDVLSPFSLLLIPRGTRGAPPVASEVTAVGKRVLRAGAHARSTPGGPEQQAQRDLDFFIIRHEHDSLHKFVLKKKKKGKKKRGGGVNVKKNPSREEGIGEGPPKPLGPIYKP